MESIRSRHAVAVATLLLLSASALAEPPGPSVATKEGVGRFLVDGAGKTLYVFKKDAPARSACQGDCVTRWPIYLNEGGTPSGLKAEDFGTITREDGQKQTTYKGMPLYTFAADSSPGDVKGQGVKDVWFVAAP